MNFDNNKKHIVVHLLPHIPHFSALQGDMLLPFVVEESGTGYLLLWMLV